MVSRKQNEELIIRSMTIHDIDSVYEIEKQCFATPWSKEAFYEEVSQNRFAHYLVLEKDLEIIGFCGLWVMFDDAQITNIAIAPAYRGNQLGEQLMKKAMGIALSLGAEQMTLEVRVSNHVAQSLYKKLGFIGVTLRKNYYQDNLEDALLMWVKLK
ncbi:ribosomal protein S18-alanine N-acetyltransferase [Bacillus carboniphilus]|uniref:[Ribosomal protein bS18]-alanine N-acetyltransferase n=1 Tax=Bacillus carboniphilus TaxID=86663 RepID=A0ABY9JV37_9BACI|nr:ribosomal protein S18-alanine N-acetyltransferase [Bacillus carboniphilus]WLR42153.1 ribosomal protein S18-alanine N-acetyltransferase [Bacillus carboniphilus]